MNRLFSHWLPLLVLILGFGTVPGVFAQEAEEPAPAPVVPEPEPELGIADLIARTEETRSDIAAARQLAEAGALDLQEISDALHKTDAEIELALASVRPEKLQAMSFREIEAVIARLSRLESQLQQGSGDIEAEAVELDSRRSRLRAESEYFRQITDPETAEDTPPALLETIDGLLEDIDEVRSGVSEQLNTVVRYRTRIAEQRRSIVDGIRVIESERGRRAQSILDPDSPMIWTELATEWEPLSVVLADAWERAIETGRDFFKSNTDAVSLFMFLLLPLGFMVFGLRRAVLAKQGDSETPVDRSVFVRWPVAITLLIWLSLIPEITMPKLPTQFGEIRGLLLVFVVWRIFPALVTFPKHAPPLRGMLFLAALEGLRGILIEGTTAGRVTSLALVIAGLVFLRNYIKIVRAEDSKDRPKFVVPIGWIIGLVGIGLVLTLVMNLYGAMDFADRALDVVMSSFVVVAVLLALDQVLRAGLDIFIDSSAGQSLNGVRRYPALIRRRGVTIIKIIILVMLITVFPRLFPLIDTLFQLIVDLLSLQLGFGDVDITVLSILNFGLSIFVAVWIARFIRFALDEDIFPRFGVATGKASAASRLIYYSLLSIGLMFALASAGFEMSQLTLLISALGVGIGFGLQGVVNNFVSGLIVAFERPFQVGDQIEVGQLWGRVRQIGLRASTIRTLEGAEVVVPNADLVSGSVINWTLSDRKRRVDIPVSVAYGTELPPVQEILCRVASEHDNCLAEPLPEALFLGFGDDGLNFMLRFWTPDADKRLTTVSEVAMNVKEEFEKAGITIPFPQRDLHLKSASEDVQKLLDDKKSE